MTFQNSRYLRPADQRRKLLAQAGPFIQRNRAGSSRERFGILIYGDRVNTVEIVLVILTLSNFTVTE
jgi:hypothetical protein